MVVKALKSPPTSSSASAMAAADRSVGALEQQVLEEVRRPGELAGLVTRPGADPEADCHRADIRHGLGDQADAARQDGRLDQRRRERPRGGRRSPRSLRSPRPVIGLGAAPGPRSPRSATSSASKASSKESPVAAGPSRRRARSRSDGAASAGPRGHRSPDAVGARAPSPSPASATLGRGGQRQRHLALRVDVVDPDLDRLAELEHVLDLFDALAPASDDSLEMCSRPSRPGQDVDEGAELGDVDHLARVDGPDLGGRRVEDQRDPPTGLLDGVAVLGADGDRARPCRRRRRRCRRRSPAAGR